MEVPLRAPCEADFFRRHVICRQPIISLPLSTPVVADDGYVLENSIISMRGPAERLKLAVANLLRQRQVQGQSYVDDAGRSDSVTGLDGSTALRLLFERRL